MKRPAPTLTCGLGAVQALGGVLALGGGLGLSGVLGLSGCGVPGAPRHGGVLAHPTFAVRYHPGGIDLWPQGALPDWATGWSAWLDAPTCSGAPAAVAGPQAPLRVSLSDAEPHSVCLEVADATGKTAVLVSMAVRWQAPPAAPEPPVVFVAGGVVQVGWLVPKAPVTKIRVLRDGLPVSESLASSGTCTDGAPPGQHTYAVVGLGPDFETAPSPSVPVWVPAPPAPP